MAQLTEVITDARKHLESLNDLFTRHRLTCATEYDLQLSIQRILKDAGIKYCREYRFNARDRADFWLPEGGIVIEAKIAGQAKSLYDQVLRYLEHAEVQGCLVITTRFDHRAVNYIQVKPVIAHIIRKLS